MRVRSRCSWWGLLALTACGPGRVGAEAGGDSTSDSTSDSSTESSTDAESDDDTSTDDTSTDDAETDDDSSDTGESETDTDEPAETDTDEPEPDLPSEPRCADWDTEPGFDGECFDPPVIIDPTPITTLARAYGDVPRIYAGGVNVHRLYDTAQLVEGGQAIELPILGTAVAAGRVGFGEGLDAPLVILTKDPHQVIVHALDPIDILANIELPAEPTAFAAFAARAAAPPVGLAVADVAGNLHVFTNEMQSLELAFTRVLPEPLDALSRIPSYFDFESADTLLGFASASQTAWQLGLPIELDGSIAAHPLSIPVDAWYFMVLTDIGPDAVFVVSESLGEARRFELPEFQQVGPPIPLAHPVAAIDFASVPVEALGGIYGLSTVDSRVAPISIAGGEAWSFDPPTSWAEVPPNTVDFLALGKLGFVCASTSEGLALVAPTSP